MSIPSATSEPSASPQPADQSQQQQQMPHTMNGTVNAASTGTASQQAQPAKRSSRRANTAERRATHNAVERARRETLNSRFLDLAAMLPNLAAVRRPSKSAIVNSSIALIHNQARARVIAARELRLLNAETNALRTELNEWRMRNNLPRVEEPVRSTDFATLLTVEDVEMGEEMVLGGRRSFDEDDGGFDEDGEEGELISPETGVYGNMGLPVRGVPMQYSQPQQQQQQQAQQQQQQHIFEQQKAAMARAQQAQLAQQQAQAQAQARYTPPSIHQQPHHQHAQSQPAMIFSADMYAGNSTAPSSEMYNPSWSQKAIASLTPPGSAHGQGAKASVYASTANSAFLSGPQQQGMFKPSYNNGGFLGVNVASSVGGSEDDQSEGSSHFSDLMGNPEQSFSFGLSTNNMGFNNVGMTGMMGYGMGNMGMMQLPPSPPHTGSPGSNAQSRRASVNIPAHSSAKSSPGPSPIPAQYGMPLMI